MKAYSKRRHRRPKEGTAVNRAEHPRAEIAPVAGQPDRFGPQYWAGPVHGLAVEGEWEQPGRAVQQRGQESLARDAATTGQERASMRPASISPAMEKEAMSKASAATTGQEDDALATLARPP